MNLSLENIRVRFWNIITWVRSHRIRATIIAVICATVLYVGYSKLFVPPTPTTYTLGAVTTGTIISSVSESGQVSANDQVTINPQASGMITHVYVHNGQSVAAGQILASIDAANQYDAVQSAKADLQSAQLSLAKLQQPPTTLSLTQAQNAIVRSQENIATAQSNLTKQYATTYNDVIAAYLALPTIMSNLQDITTGTEASRGSQWNIDAYQNALSAWDLSTATTYRNNTYSSYQTALASYNAAFADYRLTNQTSSTSTITSIAKETYSMIQDVSNANNAAGSFIQYYQTQLNNHNQNPVSESTTAANTLTSDATKVNSYLSTLLNDINQLQSDQQALNDASLTLTENQQSLAQLQAGTNSIDLQTAELNVAQRQVALQQAQDTLANYTIRAPFAGLVANLNLVPGQQVSNGTSAATLITTNQIADLSLNEVDAAKVEPGQKAILTFDALPNLSLTGTVASVSPLGTVSQGVVSYDVKVALDAQSTQVKAGMTVSATIQTAVHQNVLQVPASAVKTSNGSTYVLIPPTGIKVSSTTLSILSTETPVSIPVSTGISDGSNTEILSGLSLGEIVITKSSSANSSNKSAAASATSRSGFGGPSGGAGGIRL